MKGRTETKSNPMISTTESTPLNNGKHEERQSIFRTFSHHWLPGVWDLEVVPSCRSQQTTPHTVQTRSLKRRIFLVLTEPETSIASAVFFGFLLIAITLVNFLMVLQTMEEFQYTPTDCTSCGGSVVYVFDYTDDRVELPEGVECICPPAPLEFTNDILKWLIYFFTVEWFLRVLLFSPSPSEKSPTKLGFLLQWLSFLTSWATIFDALAIFPYYIEALTYSNSLISLRLLRLFRVFQVVRLGQYSDSFLSLTTVLRKALPYLKLLLALLVFGATMFGSLLYWTEKGEWKYFEETKTYEYIRLNEQGAEEISPFTSIPAAFWWFTVTATTVGYGDTFPTSTFGKWIAAMAMLAGVLVIAFPVSVFSDLWSKELSRRGAFNALMEGIEEDDDSFVKPLESTRSLITDASGYQHHHYEYMSTASVADTSARLPEFDRESISIRKEDLNEIVAHMNSISESQKHLRSILRKYRQQQQHQQ